MTRFKSNCLGAILACLVGLGAPAIVAEAGDTEPIPTSLAEVPDLGLGTTVAEFIGVYSATEGWTDRTGIRTFDVRPNTLPASVAAMHCEFKDNQLYFIEILLHAETPWADLVADPTQKFGLPGVWATLAGSDTSIHVALARSAVWKDEHAVLMLGQGEGDLSVIALSSVGSMSQMIKSIAEAEEEHRRQEEWSAMKVEMEAEAILDTPTFTYPGPYEVSITVEIDKDYFFRHRNGDSDGTGPDIFIVLSVDDREATRSQVGPDSYSQTWLAQFNWRPEQPVRLRVFDEDSLLSRTNLLDLVWPGGERFPLVGEVELAAVLGAELGTSRLTFEVRSSPGEE